MIGICLMLSICMGISSLFAAYQPFGDGQFAHGWPPHALPQQPGGFAGFTPGAPGWGTGGGALGVGGGFGAGAPLPHPFPPQQPMQPPVSSAVPQRIAPPHAPLVGALQIPAPRRPAPKPSPQPSAAPSAAQVTVDPPTVYHMHQRTSGRDGRPAVPVASSAPVHASGPPLDPRIADHMGVMTGHLAGQDVDDASSDSSIPVRRRDREVADGLPAADTAQASAPLPPPHLRDSSVVHGDLGAAVGEPRATMGRVGDPALAPSVSQPLALSASADVHGAPALPLPPSALAEDRHGHGSLAHPVSMGVGMDDIDDVAGDADMEHHHCPAAVEFATAHDVERLLAAHLEGVTASIADQRAAVDAVLAQHQGEIGRLVGALRLSPDQLDGAIRRALDQRAPALAAPPVPCAPVRAEDDPVTRLISRLERLEAFVVSERSSGRRAARPSQAYASAAAALDDDDASEREEASPVRASGCRRRRVCHAVSAASIAVPGARDARGAEEQSRVSPVRVEPPQPPAGQAAALQVPWHRTQVIGALSVLVVSYMVINYFMGCNCGDRVGLSILYLPAVDFCLRLFANLAGYPG